MLAPVSALVLALLISAPDGGRDLTDGPERALPDAPDGGREIAEVSLVDGRWSTHRSLCPPYVPVQACTQFLLMAVGRSAVLARVLPQRQTRQIHPLPGCPRV